MCLSVPYKVIEIEGDWAKVEGSAPDVTLSEVEGSPGDSSTALGMTEKAVEFGLSHHSHRVYLGLLKGVKVGDYLMVHEDMAINKIEMGDAEDITIFLDGKEQG